MNGEQGGFGNSDLVFGENSKTPEAISYGDNGSAARFFYVAKPSKQERNWGLGETAEYALKQNSTMREIENVDWKEFNENFANWVDDLESMVKNKKKQDKNKNDSQTDLFS